MGCLVLSLLAVLGAAGVAGALPDGGAPLGGANVGRVEDPRTAGAPGVADGPAGRPGDAGTDAPETRTEAGDSETAGQEAAKGDEARAGSSGGAGVEDGDEAKQQEGSEQASGPPPIPQPATNDLWMTIPKMDLYDDYVANSDALAAMDAGAIKLPSTGFPWQEDANTYIAAHRIGYPGTESDYQFYDLPNLALGDKVYLGDANGTTYTYEVTGFKEVLPTENYVTAPQPGRDMISLQTCIEDYGDYWTMGPNWYVRYVVEADRVSVDPA